MCNSRVMQGVKKRKWTSALLNTNWASSTLSRCRQSTAVPDSKPEQGLAVTTFPKLTRIKARAKSFRASTLSATSRSSSSTSAQGLSNRQCWSRSRWLTRIWARLAPAWQGQLSHKDSLRWFDSVLKDLNETGPPTLFLVHPHKFSMLEKALVMEQESFQTIQAKFFYQVTKW